jgi:hypothetical protein
VLRELTSRIASGFGFAQNPAMPLVDATANAMRQSLRLRLGLLLGAIALLALLAISLATVLLDSATGRGGAINVAGSLRMLTYRVALSAADASPGGGERFELAMSTLDARLSEPSLRDALASASARALLDMVRLLYDSGIPIVAGTDGLAGFALHRELELYVEAGIPAPEVLRIATLDAARVAGRETELGSIEPGKLADLVLVDGNPASRISDIRRTSLVIKDGAIYEPAALYKSIGVRP